MDQDATWYEGRPRTRHIVLYYVTQRCPQKGSTTPIFGPCLLWPNGRPSQLLLITCVTVLKFLHVFQQPCAGSEIILFKPWVHHENISRLWAELAVNHRCAFASSPLKFAR